MCSSADLWPSAVCGEERGFDCPGSCWDQHDALRAIRAEPDKPWVAELRQNLAQSRSWCAVTPDVVGTGVLYASWPD